MVEVSLDPVLQGGSSAKKTKSILSIHGKGCTGMMKVKIIMYSVHEKTVAPT